MTDVIDVADPGDEIEPPSALPDLPARYAIKATPLRKPSTRSDWHVERLADARTPLDADDFVKAMRRFFADMDAEITARAHDPIATTNALARMEALLADVRYVRDRLRDVTAGGLALHEVRRLTIDDVATVEASSIAERDWDHAKAMRLVIHRALDAQCEFDEPLWIEAETGVRLDVEAIAVAILDAAAVDYWRMGALKALGIDPDSVSETERDEAGKTIRRPTVIIKDNAIRKNS